MTKDRVYSLFDGPKKVYVGTTDDPERRAAEHQADGKNFTRMKVETRPMKPENAQKREAGMLKTYRQGHGGKNPKYNKTDDG